MKKSFSYVLFLSLLTSTCWSAVTSSTYSTSLSTYATTSHSETTSIPPTPTPYNVDSSGDVTCPEGQVMIGYNVDDNDSAYVNYDATKDVANDCSGLHFHYTNYTARLMVYPGQLGFTIYCKPIDMGFF